MGTYARRTMQLPFSGLNVESMFHVSLAVSTSLPSDHHEWLGAGVNIFIFLDSCGAATTRFDVIAPHGGGDASPSELVLVGRMCMDGDSTLKKK